MAEHFEMDAPATREGLTAVAERRSATASGYSPLPVGPYIGLVSAAAESVLTELLVERSMSIAQGVAATEASTGAVETTEAVDASSLAT
jgi:hypothetical protein